MANDFKIKYKTNVLSTGTGSILYDAPISPLSGSGAVLSSILLEVDIANTSTDNITADVFIDDSASSLGLGGDATIYVVKGAPIPANGTLKVVNGQKIVIMEKQKLKVKVDAVNAADCIVSILEDA